MKKVTRLKDESFHFSSKRSLFQFKQYDATDLFALNIDLISFESQSIPKYQEKLYFKLSSLGISNRPSDEFAALQMEGCLPSAKNDKEIKVPVKPHKAKLTSRNKPDNEANILLDGTAIKKAAF